MAEDVAHSREVTTHALNSPHQAEETFVRVLASEDLDRCGQYPAVFVLPVEPRDEHHYGNGLQEVLDRDLHRKHQAVFAAPTFSAWPWYANHPTDPHVQQERYMLEAVVPLVEAYHPVRTDAAGRFLLGFSKSGWGAFSLLLRNPGLFGRAAAWDAPLMLDQPGPYESGPIFATQANFEEYRIARLLRDRAGTLGAEPRLVFTGYQAFRRDHDEAHKLMTELSIPHIFREGQDRPHHWHSGWVEELLDLLLTGET